MIKISHHKILYGEQHFHAAFPSIVQFDDGNLLLAFRRARDAMWLVPKETLDSLDLLNRMDHIDSRSHIMLMELDKSGQKTIGNLDMLPIDPEAGDQDPSLLVLPDNNLFLASFSWYPLPNSAVPYVSARVPADDKFCGGRFVFWGAHTSLRQRKTNEWIAHHQYLEPDGGFGYKLSPDGAKKIAGSVRGQPLYYKNNIVLALYGGAQGATALFITKDEGLNWNFLSIIAEDTEGQVTFQEPALCHDGNGGLICFMRTAGADGRLATSRSKDGITWSEPKLHDLVGHPFHPLLLEDGRVLLSYGYRQSPFGIRARLLKDPLQNPDEVEEIIIRDDGLSSDLGYPWGVELEEGRVLLTYYMANEQGMRHIVGSWLEI